jgi:hypothetical protein
MSNIPMSITEMPKINNPILCKQLKSYLREMYHKIRQKIPVLNATKSIKPLHYISVIKTKPI